MTIDIQKMKERLEAKQKEFQQNISTLTEAHPAPVDPIQASEGPQDFEETAIDFTETQQEQSVEVNEQALLTLVQAALKRIEDGTYGKSVVSGKPIPEKRLEAIPWADRTVEEEEEAEERNLSREELYDTDTNVS
jgi:DnaK suppressor protein